MPRPTDPSDLSLALARELVELRAEQWTEADREQLARLMLDHLGCAYRGAALPWGETLRGWGRTYAGSGRAYVIGEDTRCAAPVAAMINATAAHGLELDDTHDLSVSHPGAVVIAAALAVAQQRGRSGAAVLTAIVAGYEAIARIGRATGAAAMIEDGFHPTAVFGTFGATAAAGTLIGLSAEGLCEAWGLALSTTGGSMQFSHEPHGTTVKRLHGGYAAQHGVTAAELAAAGISGPRRALDGVYGVCRLFGSHPQPERLLREPGEARAIHRISFKPYPCCRLFHSTLDALERVTDGFTLEPQRIASIVVGGPALLVTQHMLRRPESVMAAQYSLPFALATALFHGPRSVDGFSHGAMNDPRILVVADRVEAVTDAAMEVAFPEHFGSWVELTTREGEHRRAEVLDSVGTPARPISTEGLVAKFDELTAPVGLPATGAGVLARLRELSRMRDLAPLLEPFTTIPDTPRREQTDDDDHDPHPEPHHRRPGAGAAAAR